MPTQKENDEKLVEIMKEWQKIEDASIKMTNDIKAKTNKSDYYFGYGYNPPGFSSSPQDTADDNRPLRKSLTQNESR